MKKKTVLTPEALAAMFGGTEESALTEEEVKAAEKAKAEAEAAEEATTEAAETEETATEETATEEDTTAPELEALQAEFDAFKATTETAVTEFQATIDEGVTALATAEEASNDLKEIVSTQISKMRLALKMPPVDMTAFDMPAVVTEFNSTQEAFMKALPVGSVIPEEDKEKKVETPVSTSLDASNYKALGF